MTARKRALLQTINKLVPTWGLVVFEACLNAWIIWNVGYTEIDWETYMQQVKLFLDGVWNYKDLYGNTGPLVYPAGHVYIYSCLHYLTNGGQAIFGAQLIFGLIYILTLMFVMDIYSHTSIPRMYLILLCLSKRCHSIYVLRLFNDPFCMLMVYAGISMLLRKKHNLGAVLLSLGVSIKMNALLWIPGYMFVILMEKGLGSTMIVGGIMGLVQIVLGLPFIWTDWKGYISQAFDFSRQFLQQWSVNFQFVPFSVFIDQRFHHTLFVIHVLFLFFVLGKQYRRISRKRSTRLFTSVDILEILFQCNLAGIICARSLHYQFYAWYFHTIPWLLWRSSLSKPIQFIVFLMIEMSWNIFPPNRFVSILLLASHLVLFFSQ